MKRTIEIDVPDGCEASLPMVCNDDYSNPSSIIILLKKKEPEPEFIEVRDWIGVDYNGVHVKLTLNAREFHLASRIESDKKFIRWIDKEPRKVQI